MLFLDARIGSQSGSAPEAPENVLSVKELVVAKSDGMPAFGTVERHPSQESVLHFILLAKGEHHGYCSGIKRLRDQRYAIQAYRHPVSGEGKTCVRILPLPVLKRTLATSARVKGLEFKTRPTGKVSSDSIPPRESNVILTKR
jgi:hypothetical protein